MSLNSEPLMTLKQAATALGVHTATLRRWADNGDIVVVLTPGGHRRFPRSEVERLAGQSGGSTVQQDVASAKLEEKAIAHTRAEISEHRQQGWMQTFDEEMRAKQREFGRQVMGLMMRYVSVEDDGQDLLEEARKIGHTYAEMSMQSSLNLSQTIQAMMFFRENIVESLVVLPDSMSERKDDNRSLLRRVNMFLNAILLGVTEAYEKA